VPGNSVEILTNGDRFYPRMLEDIRAARASICIEAYIYCAGTDYYPVVPARGAHALQVVLSSPEQGGSSVQTMYFLGIGCARRSILIANPYFVPDAAAIAALLEARRRGVEIRVMVSGVTNDNWLARQNSIRQYGRTAPRRRRHSRVQPLDDAPQDHGRRRRLDHHRDHQLRQPVIRAQRREQRLPV